MASTDHFLQPYMGEVFFLYGLAFFAFGITVLVHINKDSRFELIRFIGLLVGFAFFRCFISWLDAWQIFYKSQLNITDFHKISFELAAFIRPSFQMISSFFLLEFGRKLLKFSIKETNFLQGYLIYPVLIFSLLIGLFFTSMYQIGIVIESRIIGFIGACLTAYGLISYRKNKMEPIFEMMNLQHLKLRSYSKHLKSAIYLSAGSFFIFGLLGFLTIPSVSEKPDAILLFGIPLQVMRMICGIIIAISMSRVLRLFDAEGLFQLAVALETSKQALDEMRRMSHQNELILQSTAEGIFGLDEKGILIFINQTGQKLLGWKQDELKDNVFHNIIHHTTSQGQTYSDAECPIMKTLQDKEKRHIRHDIFWRKNQTAFPVEYHVSPLLDREEGGVVVVFNDVSDRKRMILTDFNKIILNVNVAYTEMTGYRSEEVVGRNITSLRSVRHDSSFYRDLDEAVLREGHWQGEIWSCRKDGGIFLEWLTLSILVDPNGKLLYYVWLFSDVQESRDLQRKILELAFYDPLTGLPNRRLLVDRLNQARLCSSRNGQYGALLLLDLDNFAMLNDTRGHETGDQLLVEVAKRLRSKLRKSDTAAHLGGDEFMVLLEELGTEEIIAATLAEEVAEKLRKALGQPWIDKGETYYPNTSIGITLFVHHTEEADVLLKQVDLALYQAKDAGRNAIRFFSPSLQSTIDMCVKTELELRRALEEGELFLFYQPQVDGLGRVIGAEALIRWQPPGKAMVSPAVFIPVAERSGLILPIGRLVLETACQQLALWAQDPATRDLKIAVNVSAHQFRQIDFATHIQALLSRHKIDPSKLKLELTESVVVENVERIILMMKTLKNMGVSFSLDDFGTGYSSLTYLKRLPFDQVKIDQSFVRGIPKDEEDCAIAKAILALGQSLHLQVVAEGVETEAQLHYLIQHGCEYYQGYLFGRPGPAENLTTMAKKNYRNTYE